MVPRKTERHFVGLLSVLSGMGIVSHEIAFLVKICFFPILLPAKANACFHSDYSFGAGASLGPVARSMVDTNHWFRSIETYIFLWCSYNAG